MRPSVTHTQHDALHDMAAEHTRQCASSMALITAHLFSIILGILR